MDVRNQLQPDGLYRVYQIVSNRKKKIEGIFPFSRSTWLKGVADGRYPQPVRLSERVVAWKGEELLAVKSGITGAMSARSKVTQPRG